MSSTLMLQRGSREQAMDDFSFPTIAVDQDSLCRLPFPHFAASPLWFLSSVGSDDDDGSEKPPADGRLRSLSSVGEALRDVGMRRRDPDGDSTDGGGSSSSRFLDDEERMDMLWEDFNEELGAKMAGSNVSASKNDGSRLEQQSFVKRSRAHALKGTKSGGLVHRRRPSLILMMKVLKKLLLIQKAASSKKQTLCSI